MAAGLGFKDFTTGEVLTAADVDGYLMQGVWVFASAAARDAAVTSPQEGNFAYLKDTNVTTYYTGSAWANLDTTGMTNPMTTTGDTIYSSSGSTPARLGIGSTGQVLTVAGGVPTWAAPASSSFIGVRLTKSANQSISNSTATAISFNGEDYDTNSFHDNSTNNTRITIPSGQGGYYLVYGNCGWGINATGRREFSLRKNGGTPALADGGTGPTSGAYVSNIFSIVVNLLAADYIELFAFQTTGGAFDVESTTSLGTTFGVVKLG